MNDRMNEIAEAGTVTSSRRSMLGRSLRFAGGGALALALVGSPVIAGVAAAQDEEEDSGAGVGGGGRIRTGAGGRTRQAGAVAGGGGGGGGQGGGGRQGGGGDGGQGGGGGSLPSVGVGSTVAGDRTLPAMLGVAAAGAAGAALIVHRNAQTEAGKA